jgi:hypothetical protein
MGYANAACTGIEVLVTYRKSSYSGNGGNCVEVAPALTVKAV